MNETPKGLRLQIGLFGRTNVGKSSFLNYVAGQDVAITSPACRARLVMWTPRMTCFDWLMAYLVLADRPCLRNVSSSSDAQAPET